jgi:parallel beta-helix repeat protein
MTNAGHGIMLHRSVVDSVVEDNEVTGNAEGGIALLESHRNTIRGNRIHGNAVGVRLSVGSSDNVLESNDIADNAGDGMYFYQGSDAPTEGDGHPRRNRVVSNSFAGNAGYAVRLADADDNVFEGNTYGDPGRAFSLERSSGNTIDGPG